MDFEIIAHRGFSAIAPENTLAAFSAALLHGADSIEFDVQLSGDGVPVVIHDTTLDKTTGTGGFVREKTLDQLKALDAGAWFSERFAGERIPTLREALGAIREIKKFIYLDVKPHCVWSDAGVDEFVKTLKGEGWENRCVVSSFNEEFVERVRVRCGDMALGYIVANVEAYRVQLEKAAGAGNTVMISEYNVLLENPSLIEASRERGVDIVAWTVDSKPVLQRLGELGVVRIVTNSLIGSVGR
jgi:glycerophosphoryl diester phosphodiesterase